MIEHGLGPDGIAYYKELPSLKVPAPTAHLLEALTWAYQISGDIKYLKVGGRQFAAMVERSLAAALRARHLDDSGALISGVGRGCDLDKYIPLLLYAVAAAPVRLLDWYEYPF